MSSIGPYCRRLFFAVGLTLAIGACDDVVTLAPPLFTPRDDLTDDQLATEALALLGEATAGGTDNCNNCHGLTRQTLYHWRALTDTALGGCLTDLTTATQTSARQMIDCLREDPSDSTSMFRAPKVGIFTSAAHLAWFEFTFERAYGSDYLTEFDDFLDRVGMPLGAILPYTQEELDIVATWFTRGLPLIDDKLPNDPPPTECTAGVSAAVTSHVAEILLSGWRAVNAQNSLLMHGCNGAATTFDCLSSYPRAQDAPFSQGWEVNVAGQQQRILRNNLYSSAFWTRSSADGRFVANGASSGGASSFIVDLQRDVAIPGSANYDPSFFPDNLGFVFQGGGYMCNQSLLESEPASINYGSEPECTSNSNVGLYQHVGAALGGGDYWAVNGQFTSDNGGHSVTQSDPTTFFSNTSVLGLTPIIHTGTAFVSSTRIPVTTPYEGDAVISPSARMVISRLSGPGGNQLGFVMREILATQSGNSYDIALPEVARYCINGGKPAFSLDERWIVLHHYIGDADAQDLGFADASDPAFAAYRSSGAANVYLIDAPTGSVTRITHMKPGQYALYPHFRSDGWIYFIVRTVSTGSEYIVASDAALRLESL